jgi:ParB family chromosome partitioning protein
VTAKKPRLGRGLDALLGGSPAEALQPGKSGMRELPLETLQRGRFQPRTHMNQDALAELADSIRVQGVVQPIVVREIANGSFEIVAGERRWRAAQLAGLETVPVVVRNLSDEAAVAVALIENIQREDLNPVEEANALKRLLEEFDMTHQQVAEAVGRSRAAVTNLLRLLSLNPDVLKRLDEGEIEMGHARALLALSGRAQSDAARRIAERGLSVREAEALVRRAQQGGGKKGGARKPAGAADPDIRRLQDELSERIGATVSIAHTRSGKGRLVIEYHSADELEGILARIR